jgi:PKD repeat protein
MVHGQDSGDNPASCHADFIANPDPINPMMVHFQDKSMGQITHWQWSFGDGATSSLPNPTHTYAAGGTYFVCLTVSDSDPGFICHDVSCAPVTIHEPGKCVADYTYQVDSFDQSRIHFFDKSSGHINRWHWDFGDGTVSDNRNPVHVFSGFDKYRVCLTAFDADSVSVCNDIKCDSVDIKPAPVCHASFDAVLDSLNHFRNTFKFDDHSIGEPTNYRWWFDDGSTYTSKNVIHQFHTPGPHKVCLFIAKEEHGVILCKDSVCQVIKMAKYFNLGGHLFTGTFPINNPVSTGDTGIAYLFRKNGAKLFPFDTVKFTNLGYYAFPDILNGDYLVRAKLTPGSVHYAQYFPAYFSQALKWQEGSILKLSDSNLFSSHIYLVPANNTLSGQGRISGDVVKANTDSHPEAVRGAEILLYDSQMKPLMFSTSGDSGKFEFSNLPYGLYNLYVEHPGKYSRITSIWLDSSKPVADSVRLEVFEYDVTGIAETAGSGIYTGELFPNPVGNTVSLFVNVEKAMPLSFEICAMTRNIIYSESILCQTGSNTITLPVHNIPTGIYLFVVKSRQGAILLVKKMVK